MVETRRQSAVLVRGTASRRIRVARRTAADERWAILGRPHFLNRDAFERHRVGRRWLPSALADRAMTVSPLVDGLVSLTLLFLPFWLMWRATQWVCPPATSLTAWLVGQLRQILRYLARWLHRQLWQRPAAQYGTAVALWLVLVVAVVFCAVVLLVKGKFGSVLGLLPWAATLAGYWYLLRWWRTRLYRPRPLPRRRRPRNG